MGSIPACGTFHRENRTPKYFGTYTIWHWKCPRQWLEVKTEMFRPIAIRNQLTTPYGRKVLGNLKQCWLIIIILTSQPLPATISSSNLTLIGTAYNLTFKVLLHCFKSLWFHFRSMKSFRLFTIFKAVFSSNFFNPVICWFLFSK